MDPAVTGPAIAIAKFFLVVLFPFSALDKAMHWKAALQQANSSFLPGGATLLVLAMIVETAGPVCILLGWHERPAAALLAAFSIVTALVYHEFWRYRDFWSDVQSPGRAHFWDFLKNFGLAGGLMLLALLADPAQAGSANPSASSSGAIHLSSRHAAR